MGYNSGNFSFFNQAENNTTVFADLQKPAFNPNNTTYGTVYGVYIAPSIVTTGTGIIGSFYGQQVALSITATAGTVSVAYSVNVSGPSLSSGTLTTSYSLYVTPSSGAGTVSSQYTAYFAGATGIGTTTPKNFLDVLGSVAVGTYAGGITAPISGMIVSGTLGIAKTNPATRVDVNGIASAGRIYAPGTTVNNQLIQLAMGNNQAGFSSGFAAMKTTMSANTTQVFNMGANVQSNSVGYIGGVFDGRYIYFSPFRNKITLSGQITRYDTTLSFSSSMSYTVFNTSANVNSLSVGFSGGLFDGRYVYLVPFNFGQITRYDTTLPFSNSTSYSVFNTQTNVNSNSFGFIGGAFDGRFLYFAPGNTASSQITRYDTNFSFNSSASYQIFSISTNINSLMRSFNCAVFDGRYIYYVPSANLTTISGQIVRYDSTLSFGNSVSYATFDSKILLNSLSSGFAGGVFDGRYVYFIPYINNVTFFGQITRYDTTLNFNSSVSYAIFDTKLNVNSNSAGFQGGVFDGRYIYLVPYLQGNTSFGQITRYDVTLSFTSPSSYMVFNTQTAVNSLSAGFQGGIFDGHYVYLIPNQLAGTSAGQITRITGYTGPQATALTATQAANGFSVGSYAGTASPTGGLIVSGNMGIGVSSPGVTLDVTGGIVSATRVYTGDTTANNQRVGLMQGNNQGGFGSGSVGLNKAMSANTTLTFDTAVNINSNSTTFEGGIFDGRFLYFAPASTASGQITRYDTTLSFSSSSSYSVFDTDANINSNSAGFMGAVYDGRYVYYVPNTTNTVSGQVTRYDTTGSFSASSSYTIFNTALVQSNSVGFAGGIFDGRYVYFVPNSNARTLSGLVTRFDTTASFSLTSSYATYDTGANENSKSVGFIGGTFDGRYVYFAPNQNKLTLSGQITQYDTSLAFNTNSSYFTFDTAALVNSNSVGFTGCVFDGRFIYFVPNQNIFTLSGQITRYDTTLPFASSSSYAVFDTAANVNFNSVGFRGGIFDERYVYFVPNQNFTSFSGQITRFDTTLPFTLASSYQVLDTANIQSNSVGFYGCMFDGRYVYFVPNQTGQITRIDAYAGPQVTAITAPQAANGFTVGAYSGMAAPINGLLVSGSVGISSTSPIVSLDVGTGIINATRVYQSGTTFNNQLIGLAEGNNQGGLGGGFVGTNKVMSANTTVVFDTAGQVNSRSKGFSAGIFDGRFLYLIPYQNELGTYSGLITRYDTTLPFLASSSYTYDMVSNVHSASRGFSGAIYDGRYIYFVPFLVGFSTYSGQVTRYDTYSSFTAAGSYLIYDLAANVQSNSVGFQGAIFDGRYVYFVPFQVSLSSYSGQITRYDTTLPFAATSSYSVFDTATNVNSNSVGFAGGTFDGQYVYFAPFQTQTTYSGQITRYDTTASFTSSASYVVFDTAANLNANSKGFWSSVFDGKYIYFLPNVSSTASSQITRYDTTSSFSLTTSYSVFETVSLGSSTYAAGFAGSVFDERYIYWSPMFSPEVLRFDTTLPFSLSTSYSIFDTSNVNSNSQGFQSAVFDGKYVYLIPYSYNGQLFGQITRLDAYPGPQATAMIASQAPNGFSVGTLSGPVSPNNVIVGGAIGVGTPSPVAAVNVPGAIMNVQQQVKAAGGTTFVNQIVSLFEGNNQGGSGGGSVGTQKTMSANTTLVFNTFVNVNSSSFKFAGSIFDGRYLYLIPNQTASGQITRYDTTLSFASSVSYSVFSPQITVSNSGGFCGGVFDGQYIYYIPNVINTASGAILRYDTTSAFTSVSSYVLFDSSANVNSNSLGFIGGVFDGRYVYFVPYINKIGHSGQITQYDTTLPFTSASSYNLFDTGANVNSNSVGFFGGAFDGRYVYFIPYVNAISYSGQVTLYDTTLSFTTASSYAIFDTKANINSNSQGFKGAVFDGLYLYFVPGTTSSGQITRYNTSGAFTSTSSYSVFDTSQLQSNSVGFQGGFYDGRYVYFAPYMNAVTYSGQITKYDTTFPFSGSTSYSVFDLQSNTNSRSVGFFGVGFDGRFLYFIPNTNGRLTRMDAYPGSQAVALSAFSAPNGLTILGGGGFTLASMTTTTTAGTGTGGILPAQVAGYWSVTINGTVQKIPYYNV